MGSVFRSVLPFSGAPPLPPPGMTPWDRELGVRQARIAPVNRKPRGIINLVSGDDLVDGDFFTLPDGVNPPVEYEFDVDTVPTITPGRERIPYSLGQTIDEVKLTSRDVINATSSMEINATIGPGTELALEHELFGEIGNQTILKSVTDPNFTVDGMDGGALGDQVSSLGIASAKEGAYVFLLGYDLPGKFHRFVVGDSAQVSQSADFGTATVIRIWANVRTPEVIPSGVAWKLSMSIDGTERVARVLEAGRDRELVDLAANVSKLTGDHLLAIKLELVTA